MIVIVLTTQFLAIATAGAKIMSEPKGGNPLALTPTATGKKKLE